MGGGATHFGKLKKVKVMLRVQNSTRAASDTPMTSTRSRPSVPFGWAMANCPVTMRRPADVTPPVVAAEARTIPLQNSSL
ncbi:hypothetical protein EV578_10120 [Streptomyces sp. BK205]|nr:hypothetical protein EV578_10120 [Streptomyces sp. BK205]